MNPEFGVHKFRTLFLDTQERGKIKGVYLARRGDVDKGGVLVVVILVKGCVRALGRGERLGDSWRKADMWIYFSMC